MITRLIPPLTTPGLRLSGARCNYRAKWTGRWARNTRPSEPTKMTSMMSSTSTDDNKRPPFVLGSAAVTHSEPLENSKAKWIGLRSIDWIDETGKERKWEASYRKTAGESASDKPDAVAIFTLVSRPQLPLSTILVLQFRPPVNSIVVELPAGLIDENESAETAALRELREETGYGNGPNGGLVKVEEISEILVNDPGMSSANMVLAKVSVSLDRADVIPEPQQEQGEHIQVELVPLKSLYETLQQFNQRPGYVVDARLMHLALGLTIQ
ncbi:uncharacterized protein PGTG_17110 [Puccinia graminis f. sp. tritici CRL 75-36-700-3]|uniref:Nudix hydrolase domain-containing protein n=1 Tax=Puccinia graminis f. sp. tritici (strain CRL 75-36-700-3 / race SCCL) TaxID=418459 RepID=E3L3X8_PUCGT|nr:uncharacterized protein PGTG_17110 [Puccinia graminis f. sp. tritici CRL 75-36-700-3]EFP91253.1 hypothetical protein PGTG_17110 [Puccinia graminis f. sp. tritici CRL 75-36-700-3]